MSQNLQQRISRQMADGKKNASVADDAFTKKFLDKKAFKTSSYSNNAQYRVPKDLKQNPYSSGTGKNRYETQTFGEKEKANRLGNQDFSTRSFDEASRTASQSNNTFRDAGDRFKTGEVRDAARSQQDNKRPMIIKPEGGLPAEAPLSEDDVRRLINRK